MSTIAAGTTSGTALVSTGNTDGTIQLQVNGTTPSVTLATTGAIGVGSTPGYGTSGQVLTSGGSSAAPTWGAVSLTSGISGTLPIANGGTNSTATPTAGTIPYGTGTALAYTAAGSSGQILQSNGASAPSWVAAPGGGSWIYISTVTASAASTVDVTGMGSTYDMYMIVAQNVSSSDSVEMRSRIYLGGSLQTSSFYGYIAGVMDSAWAIASNTGPTDSRGVMATAAYINTGGTPDRNFVLYFPNVNSTTKAHGFWGTGQENRTTSRPHVYHISVNYANIGSAMTGVQFYMGTGTITGTFRLYGLKNS